MISPKYLSKETEFFILLLQFYANSKQRTTADILDEWDRLNLTEFIFSMYDIYHIERLENACEDTDRLIAEHRASE